jgi:hypothetical protein
LRLATLTRPTKCAPFVSKLYRAAAARFRAESLPEDPAVVLEDVVFARHVKDRQRQLRHDLLHCVELRGFREVREIAGVQHEGRRVGRGLDLRDGVAQRGRDVGVARFAESDMAVADLREMQAAGPRTFHSAGGVFDRHALELAAGSVHTAAVPAHAMHWRNPRRSYNA